MCVKYKYQCEHCQNSRLSCCLITHDDGAAPSSANGTSLRRTTLVRRSEMALGVREHGKWRLTRLAAAEKRRPQISEDYHRRKPLDQMGNLLKPMRVQVGGGQCGRLGFGQQRPVERRRRREVVQTIQDATERLWSRFRGAMEVQGWNSEKMANFQQGQRQNDGDFGVDFCCFPFTYDFFLRAFVKSLLSVHEIPCNIPPTYNNIY